MRYIAIMGFGVIGSGVYDVITTNQKILKKNIGEGVEIKYILDLREFPNHPANKLITHNIDDIISDKDVELVVETMGGVEPAFTFEERALKAGKHVVTSNKELVEAKGAMLFEIARKHSVNFFFEASVGGGIPIIRGINSCLTADKIEEVSGILNGTTNYILTSMNREGVSYEDALKKAQELGYAEKDPTADVEGHDAGRKIAILASMVTGKNVSFDKMSCEGISKITKEDFLYARKLGMSVKLIATAYFLDDDKVMALVAPRFVPSDNDLYAVEGVFNAVSVHGNMVDHVMFYGRGAGSHATASAVVADIVEALKRNSETVYPGWSNEEAEVIGPTSAIGKYFIRVNDMQKQEDALEILGGGKIVDAGVDGEYGIVTGLMDEETFAKKLSKIDGVIMNIRIK